MSVQFGIWNVDGQPLDPGHLEKIEPLLTQYGPDSGNRYVKTTVKILYRAFHTTTESLREKQPHVTETSVVITWDGRLDNRPELIGQLTTVLPVSATDVSIVAAAYKEWGTNCFPKLVGDWAVSILNPNLRSLILAKDPIGSRHLFYSREGHRVTWSTILDPLVLFAGHSFVLNEEYVAGCFSLFPAAHSTPYAGIHSVPPSSYVTIRFETVTTRKYWDFNPAKRIRYATDAEYEEHFRAVFVESVRRRLRSSHPVLAELSGGMDSSSIVCVADKLIAESGADTPRLDTLSYYDESEPNWNERPYFAIVEKRRGQTGCHIPLQTHALLPYSLDQFASAPGAGTDATARAQRFAECLTTRQNRVVLSGIGGDEVTGGVPTPIPELADLLARGHLSFLRRQLVAWALAKKKPVIHLLAETINAFLPLWLTGVPEFRRAPEWLKLDFVQRNHAAVHGYESPVRLFSGSPSFQGNLSTLDVLRRQLGCHPLCPNPPFEKRYPFLDRDLLEFLFAVPREQLLRPGQRRSLMRRALGGIVPHEILHRKRKAFVTRAVLASVAADWESVFALTQDMVSGSIGAVDSLVFREVIQQARHGKNVPLVPLLRTLSLEYWLRHLIHWGFRPLAPAAKAASDCERVQLA
jgi:asparagine synthase (glutamine-hydrolysing)